MKIVNDDGSPATPEQEVAYFRARERAWMISRAASGVGGAFSWLWASMKSLTPNVITAVLTAVLVLFLAGHLVLPSGGCSWPAPPAPGPGPHPPQPPQPPAPIPAPGFRVLIVYDAATLTKLPAAQQEAIYSADVRAYLDAHCAIGSDGKTKEWRMWPDGTDGSADGPVWADVMKRKRDSLPWLVVSDGKVGWEGPLPATAADLLTLLKKYGGP